MDFDFLTKRINKNNISVNLNFISSPLLLLSTGILSSCLVILSPLQSLAGDPFRTNNPKDIPVETEVAFKTLFEDGNYVKAKRYLLGVKQIPENDPLFSALVASLAYTEEDWQTLDKYSRKTLQVAESIRNKDPLRSNLYLAVGHFLDGANVFQKQGAVAAIAKLQLVFNYFEKAEAIDSKDPELNLIKGYLNLFLAVHLPFSNPQQAIDNLKNYGSPQYLVNRGIAVAYRDLDDYDSALRFVNKAIESTPVNPELYYLKGQILKKKGRENKNVQLLEEAVKNFDIALAKVDQLPERTTQKPLRREKRKTLEYIQELSTTSRK